MRRPPSFLIILCVALIVLGADQWSKFLIEKSFPPDSSERIAVINGFFDITHLHNTGAVAGLLLGNNKLLTAFSVLAIILLVVFRHSFITSHREHLLALGLILGGILGNLVDRIVRKYVVDFLYLHWGDLRLTYVFNIADAAICIGVILYLFALLVPKRPWFPSLKTPAEKDKEKNKTPSIP